MLPQLSPPPSKKKKVNAEEEDEGDIEEVEVASSQESFHSFKAMAIDEKEDDDFEDKEDECQGV